jgi:hypothetical protein
MRAVWPQPAPSLSSSPPRRRRTDKISTPSHALHGARCCPCCALCRASARSLYRRAEPSPPSFSPCAGSRCLYVIRSYKRDIPLAFCPHPHSCLPLVSHRCRTVSVFYRSISAKPPHPTSLPVRRPRSSARPQSYSQPSSSYIFSAVELRRCRPHR